MKQKILIHENVKNAHDIFIKLMEEGYLPKVIRLNTDGNVTAFIYEKSIYFENEEYEDCKEILFNMGLADRMKWNVNFSNIAGVIEEIYTNGSNISSFWTNSLKFNKAGFRYKADNYEQNNELLGEEYITADKNKSYSNALINLPFLISVDFKTDKMHIYENQVIESHYLYVVEVTQSNILLPNTNIYCGYHINKCIEKGYVQGKDFIIKEYVETKKHPNYLKQMILDIYDKVENNVAKQIVNVYIGRMERVENVDEYLKPNKIICEEEMKTYEGDYQALGVINNEKYYMCLETNKVARVCNRKPIAIQVKDYARFTLFDFMVDNDISNNDVIQVKQIV